MTRRIATYERVSSDDQRERETILTQYDELQRRLSVEPGIEIVQRYVDDGVSGTTELKDRPAGCRLLRAAACGAFDELWIYKLDRLGRDDIDPLVVRRDLTALGIVVFSLKENLEDPFVYAMLVAMAAQERRTFLARSKDGMARAAREGRYCGGIVPFGYYVEGKKQTARLAPDDGPLWGDRSAADIIRLIFDMSGRERLSCFVIADRLNAMGVPTHYARDGRLVNNERRGERKARTAGVWRPSRVRALLTQTVYKGENRYGKHPPKRNGVVQAHDVISSECPPLVATELWEAAQRTLNDNRIAGPGTQRRTYLLRSKIKCALCDLTFYGAPNRGRAWYRCGGKISYRSKLNGKCLSKAIDGGLLEPQIIDDITRFLRDPGDLLDELHAECVEDAPEAANEAERLALKSRLAQLEAIRQRTVSLVVKGIITEADAERELKDVAAQQATAAAKLAGLELVAEAAPAPLVGRDLREELRERLDAGLTREQWQEIVGLLVRQIVARTEVLEDGNKLLKLVIEYAFAGVVQTDTGIRDDRSYTTAKRVLVLR